VCRGDYARGSNIVRPGRDSRARRTVRPRPIRPPDFHAERGELLVRRLFSRLLVAFDVAADALLGLSSFVIAYTIRFHTGLIPITKGIPPLRQYLTLLPFIAVLVPLGFHLQSLYRLRRGRSRVDDFFAVFVGTILAVVFGIFATLYVQAYIAPNDRGAFQVSNAVWGLFLFLNVSFTYALRELVCEALER